MKKTLLLGAAFCMAIGMNAQTKTIAELCNFLDIEAEKSVIGIESSTFTNGAKSKNGCVFYESENSSSTTTWNIKDGYADERVASAELAGEVDAVATGTMFRGVSGARIEMGAFTLQTEGKVQVYWQPNGTSERGIKISCDYAGVETTDARAFDSKEVACRTEITLPAGAYYDEDVVISVTGNTVNIFGINIVGLNGAGIAQTIADAGVSFNGREILNPQGKNVTVYNTLGQQVAASNSTINTDNFKAGVYVVRVEGVKSALKIRK